MKGGIILSDIDTVAGISFDLNLNMNSLESAISEASKIVSDRLTMSFSTVTKSCEGKIKEMSNAIENSSESALDSIKSVSEQATSKIVSDTDKTKTEIEQKINVIKKKNYT